MLELRESQQALKVNSGRVGERAGERSVGESVGGWVGDSHTGPGWCALSIQRSQSVVRRRDTKLNCCSPPSINTMYFDKLPHLVVENQSGAQFFWGSPTLVQYFRFDKILF